MSKPFFSVVIPTFNQSNYLKRALKSVVSQKFHNYEIIVIDNFSNGFGDPPNSPPLA
mgnify:CR=1 FL=1